MLAFFRSKRFLILLCVFLGLSALSPLLLVGMGSLMNSMSDIYDEFGMDVTGMTDVLSSTSTIGVTQQISDISSTGLLVFLLLINSYAGGEQKKRSIIIPRSAGLGNLAYILPKFIVYPISVFVLSLLGTIVAAVISALVFDDNDIIFRQAVAGGALLGVFNMLFVCLHLTIGTATGKAGMSSAICIVASMLLPNFFAIISVTPVYNPFTMNITAQSVVLGNETAGPVSAAVALTVVIMVFVYSLALFVQNAKKIDNSGNEILI